MLTADNNLIKKWNNFFGYNCIENFSGNTYDDLFNSYLYYNNKNLAYDFLTKICFVEKNSSGIYNVTYYNNENIINEEINQRSKRKFYNLISDFEIIITKNFPLNDDSLDKNKIVLRHEIIKNILTSNETHFFSNDLPFSIQDNRVFLTKIFYDLLFENEERLNILKFGSFLLNKFEIGLTIDDIKLKPKISVSHYGRWYWSGTEKIQNDIKSRQKIYKKFIKYGKILTVDLASGEPTILCDLSNSILLKKLLKYRIALKKVNVDLSKSLKSLINIFIHSSSDYKAIASQFKSHDKLYLQIEQELGISIEDLLGSLQDEFLCYNNSIIDMHKKNLSVKEMNRRIVIPHSYILTDEELIKEHRKYLQGHTHDRILSLAQKIYSLTGLLPIFTVHDSISYFINNYDSEDITNKINEIFKNEKYPITIEIIESA